MTTKLRHTVSSNTTIVMTVNVISESVLFPKQWGGVHAAFLSHVQVLKKMHIKIAINSLQRADITHVHTFGPFAFFKMFTSKHIVVTSHHLPRILIGSYRGAILFQGVIKHLIKFYYNKADLVLALNSKTKKDLIELGVRTRIEILPNAINTELFKPNLMFREHMRGAYNIAKSDTVLLSAGYIIPRKGIKEFMSLAKEFPRLRFEWVGGTPLKLIASEVKDGIHFVKKYKKNFLITGFVPHQEMPLFYNMADIFLFPSFQETQGLVVLEAAACGLPLILRDLPEYRVLYKKSYISCTTHEQFKEAITKLTTDKNAYDKAKNASLHLAKTFSLEAIGSKLLAYYVSLSVS